MSRHSPAPPLSTRTPTLTLALMSALALALATLALATLAPGCGSKCAANCPPSFVRITAASNVNLPLQDLTWSGPACQDTLPRCRGDDQTTSCVHIDVVGIAEGECAVTITLTGLPAQVVHTQFGPRPTQGCCTGFPVIGDNVFVIPVGTDAGITGLNGGSAQVTPAATDLPDAGADGDAGAGADASADAGASLD